MLAMFMVCREEMEYVSEVGANVHGSAGGRVTAGAGVGAGHRGRQEGRTE